MKLPSSAVLEKLGAFQKILSLPEKLEYGDFCLFLGDLKDQGIPISEAKDCLERNKSDFETIQTPSYFNLFLRPLALSQLVDDATKNLEDFHSAELADEGEKKRPWQVASALKRAEQYLSFFSATQTKSLSFPPIILKPHQAAAARQWLRAFCGHEETASAVGFAEALNCLFRGEVLSFEFDTTTALILLCVRSAGGKIPWA